MKRHHEEAVLPVCRGWGNSDGAKLWEGQLAWNFSQTACSEEHPSLTPTGQVGCELWALEVFTQRASGRRAQSSAARQAGISSPGSDGPAQNSGSSHAPCAQSVTSPALRKIPWPKHTGSSLLLIVTLRANPPLTGKCRNSLTSTF